ncbi:MAG: ABC transporter ATP-binding protein [Bacilli bacterium]|nr:ABC transporter ATP-binding protein [Bacilli bacterium]
MIELRHLSSSYGKRQEDVLRDVSFTLQKGQVGIILGPNGAGKSTLLKSVVGLLRPVAGEILIEGKPLSEYKARERAAKIAYVPQSISFAPATVFATVMLGRLPYFSFAPSKEDEKIVRDTLEEMGLASFAERNVLELSGGEKQKVAIARALAQQTDIIVFDEPTSNLDITNESAIVSAVSELAKEKGKTILFSIHDLNLALATGNHFLFLKEGSAIAEGDVSVFTEETVEKTFGIKTTKLTTEEGTYFIYGGRKP